jgi:hypothetical protein
LEQILGINIRTKGQNGEREVALELNLIIRAVLTVLGMFVPDFDIVQRNQNQTAVGGNDLSNTFGLSIEVKRQETLQIETWWKQCEAAANRNNEMPVLIYRQNRQKCRVVTYGWLQVSDDMQKLTQARIEMSWDDFKLWFYQLVKFKLENGYELKV